MSGGEIMRIVKRTGFILSAILLTLFAACGGGTGSETPGSPKNVSITITKTANTRVGATAALNVTVSNTTNQEFTLSVSSAGSGCVKSGSSVSCAPTAVGVYTVTVTAAADMSKKSDATLTVTPAWEQVSIPVTISLSSAIAGAQFEFKPTAGLEFASFERSAAVMPSTPVQAEKNGNTNVGFFTGSNSFAPTGGALNAGNLVFSWSGASGQSVTMSKVLLSRVKSGGSGTDDETITNSYTVQIPDSGGQGFRIGF
jgi:hypothetical protein